MCAEVEVEAAVAAAAPVSIAATPRQAPPPATYDQFNQLLGKPSKAQGGKKAKPASSSAFSSRGSGSLAAVGQLKDAVPPRPAAPLAADKAAVQLPQPPASGMIQINLRKAAAPVKLTAKPQASAAAREAAQRPAPPQPAPKPTLAAKPARPAAPEPPTVAMQPAAVAAPEPPAALVAPKPPAAVAAPEPPPQAPAAVAQPAEAPKCPAVPVAQPPAKPAKPAKQVAPPVAAKPEPRKTKPAAVQAVQDRASPAPAAPAAAEHDGKAPPAAPTPAGAQKPAPVQVEAAAPAEVPHPAQTEAAADAVGEASSRPQRLQSPAQQQQQQQAGAQRAQEQRRAANAAYGAEALLDRRVETLTVWQVNSAGVLVRNERLSGFVPSSLLAPATVGQVFEEEQRLAAAAAAGSIVAQLEQEGAPASTAEGASLDAATRSGVRREALAAVMMGRQLSALVVNVDEKSGRVVLSERAAVSAYKQPGARAAPPTLEELRAAARQLGDVVDATVVVVKPFGCFVEFSVGLPAADADAVWGDQQAAPRSTVLVGLVHASEVSWDPRVDIMQAVKVGQQVRAKIMHVDAAKARVFLSMRRTAPNPLLETLDSLVTSAAAASQAGGPGGGGGSGGAASGSSGGGGTGPAAAQLDQRPALGDLPEAAGFAQLLRASPSVHSVALGVRLQSRAASQSLEVYIAKNPAAGIGSAVAAAGSTPSGSAAGAQPVGPAPAVPGDALSYNLVLRKETSVQEVALVASLDREEVRQLAATCVAELAAEAEVAAA
ncbi:hypothetical protein ABPG75_013712 [Micractinium tetrahymenae]